MYFVTMILVPLLSTFFFVDLMKEGLPLKVPTAIVDLDHSPLSRSVTRSLNAGELINITHDAESYSAALDLVKKGEVFGFFIIPENFEKKAYSGEETTMTYYSNLTFYVPGTLSFKGFKSTAVAAMQGISETTLTMTGLPEDMIGDLMVPVNVNIQQPGNPWTNYSIYLSNSFAPGVLALMVMLVTAFSICEEIKRATSTRWLDRAGGSVVIALFGKLIPQSVIFTIIGIGMQAVLYKFCHFPLNNHPLHMILAVWLLVVACQWLAVTFICVVPNLRLALSLCSLTGILAFSIAAFSFPVEAMYGGIGIFSYILPIRYYFLIYIDQALNGIPIFYSRWYYIALMLFVPVGLLGVNRLKKRLLNPVYVP